jgi:hypothetical protein
VRTECWSGSFSPTSSRCPPPFLPPHLWQHQHSLEGHGCHEAVVALHELDGRRPEVEADHALVLAGLNRVEVLKCLKMMYIRRTCVCVCMCVRKGTSRKNASRKGLAHLWDPNVKREQTGLCVVRCRADSGPEGVRCLCINRVLCSVDHLGLPCQGFLFKLTGRVDVDLGFPHGHLLGALGAPSPHLGMRKREKEGVFERGEGERKGEKAIQGVSRFEGSRGSRAQPAHLSSPDRAAKVPFSLTQCTSYRVWLFLSCSFWVPYEYEFENMELGSAPMRTLRSCEHSKRRSASRMAAGGYLRSRLVSPLERYMGMAWARRSVAEERRTELVGRACFADK